MTALEQEGMAARSSFGRRYVVGRNSLPLPPPRWSATGL
ncbi:hypothetical protein I540_4247 [Mycobacteroides abscessus subsp. bolletii 1513]|uniref:Uncharacterized protein n=1 Tax=Mycobacteroides abscessus subsp. bolletii 1513 TaxID=1299321 RepID=X8DIJ7_9MYCO|nr:hypothetical protein I540_4247 [Mycobacteroides abscessus subsp. bolletii 1513]